MTLEWTGDRWPTPHAIVERGTIRKDGRVQVTTACGKRGWVAADLITTDDLAACGLCVRFTAARQMGRVG